MKIISQIYNFLATIGIVTGIIVIIMGFVLLPSPKLSHLLDGANSVLIQANIKEIENASERYYIEKQNWPKLNNEPYTIEQIKAFTKQTKDRTGKVIELDPEGQYYNIDYVKLQSYIRIPQNNRNYIIQIPSGKVYYLDDLTDTGKEQIAPDMDTSISAYEEYYNAIRYWIKNKLKVKEN